MVVVVVVVVVLNEMYVLCELRERCDINVQYGSVVTGSAPCRVYSICSLTSYGNLMLPATVS